MGVIPICAGPVSEESVAELTATWHGVLSYTRYAIHGVGHIKAMPVQRHTIGNRFVPQMHLDQLALPGPDLRTRRGAVDGESGNGPTANGQRLLPGHQVHPYVRWSCGVGDHIGNEPSRHRVVRH